MYIVNRCYVKAITKIMRSVQRIFMRTIIMIVHENEVYGIVRRWKMVKQCG